MKAGKYNVAVAGATGLVGRKFLKVLEEKLLPVNEYYLFASERSAGTELEFMGRKFTVLPLNEKTLRGLKIDFALFSAGGAVSSEYAPRFVKKGAVVIDNSAAWRMNADVPLVVPEVNPEDAFKHRGIVANPNCSTIQAAVALNPLHKKYGLKRVIYSTYQAVSGAGRLGCEDLENGAKGLPPRKFPKPIFSNVLPHIDSFMPDGYTKEEHKMIFETRKILHAPDLKVTATAVRVPVFSGHSESINAEFARPVTLAGVRDALSAAPGVILCDEPENCLYPVPSDAADRDEVFVGRVRIDASAENAINMWVVADNVRKGAATNAVQILELLIKNEKTAKGGVEKHVGI